MKVGFIGAGRVGISLGKYFIINGLEVSGFYSRSQDSAKSAADFTGTACFTDIGSLIKVSDVIFLTVPDGTITQVYNEAVQYDVSGKLLCHCSGAMTAADAFPDAEKYSTAGISVHPLFPVSSRTESYKQLGEAFFCIEGDSRYTSEWKNILESFGNNVRLISGNDKSRYHAACSIASNLVCALMDESISLLEKCGFTEKEALSALRPLAMSNMQNIFSAGTVKALTGPVERNDISTVRKHIEIFSEQDSLEMYKATVRRLVRLAKEKNPDTDYEQLYSILIQDK